MELTGTFTFFEQFFGLFGVGMFLFVVVLYAVFFGSIKIKQLALSVPLALFLFGSTPASVVSIAHSALPAPTVSGVLFGALFILSFFIMKRSSDSWQDGSGLVEAVLSAAALTLLLVLASYTVASPDVLAPYYPDTIEPLFTNAQNTFWIVVASLVLLFVV